MKATVQAETLTDGSIVYNVIQNGEAVAHPANEYEARAICNSLNAEKADRRAVKMGAEDKNINRIDPTYRGQVEINGEVLDVINSTVFSGILHWGLLGRIHGEAVVGWIPACLCNIPNIE